MSKPTTRTAAAKRPQRAGTERKAAPAAKRAAPKPKADAQAVRITHPERIVYPDTAITKQDVADY